MIDTHGIKMTGLKAAAAATKGLQGYYSGLYEELFFDRRTGEVWTKTQCSFGHNSWTVYHDEQIIKICDLDDPTTMKEIADLIKWRVEEVEAMEAQEAIFAPEARRAALM